MDCASTGPVCSRVCTAFAFAVCMGIIQIATTLLNSNRFIDRTTLASTADSHPVEEDDQFMFTIGSRFQLIPVCGPPPLNFTVATMPCVAIPVLGDGNCGIRALLLTLFPDKYARFDRDPLSGEPLDESSSRFEKHEIDQLRHE
jgi:hypothetical protein